jgi:hypothetical protein
VEFKAGMSLRNPREDGPADYLVSLEYFARDAITAEVEFERENGQQFQNLFIELQRQWKFVRVAGKRVYNLSANADIYQIDLRAEHSGFSVGVANTWDMRPHVAFVAGTSHTKQVGLVGIADIQIDSMADSITRDFENWNHEASLTVSAALTSVCSAFVKFREQYYSKFDWQIKCGLSFRLMEKNK